MYGPEVDTCLFFKDCRQPVSAHIGVMPLAVFKMKGYEFFLFPECAGSQALVICLLF